MSEQLTIKGRIIEIFPTQQVSEKFANRPFAIATDGEFSQTIGLEFQQDKCSILDKYVVGQEVIVSYNLKGRVWVNDGGVNKYFNTLSAWKIEAKSQF